MLRIIKCLIKYVENHVKDREVEEVWDVHVKEGVIALVFVDVANYAIVNAIK
jgi:ribosome-binding factor A